MRKPKINHQGHIIRRRSFLFLVPLILALAFVLAACGSNGGTTTGAGSTPTSAPTTVKGTGTSFGCPNNTAMNSAQSKPNVTVQLKDSRSTITAHSGDLIEVRLPFGQQWNGPTGSQGALQLQSPAGYALMSAKVCIWRFVAQGSGTTQLNFVAKAICKKGALCPQYILDVPFTISVK